jgi:hypothetical protein
VEIKFTESKKYRVLGPIGDGKYSKGVFEGRKIKNE